MGTKVSVVAIITDEEWENHPTLPARLDLAKAKILGAGTAFKYAVKKQHEQEQEPKKKK